MDIVAFGDNIVDRFVDRRIAYPGGNCVNVAVFAADAGADAAYVGVVGDDPAGDMVLDALRRRGVDSTHVVRRHGPTGVTDLVTRDGDRVFLDWNDGGVTTSAPYVIDPAELAWFDEARLVHSSVYSAAERELPKLRSVGPVVSFDYSSEPEYRTDAYLRSTAPYVDLALFSGGAATAGDVARLAGRAAGSGAGLVLVTRGSSGAVLTDGAWSIEHPAVVVPEDEIVDTTGCGDAFLTGFVLRLLDGGWERGRVPAPEICADALRAGAERAARQCYVEGAFGMGRPYDDDTAVAVPTSTPQTP